MKRAALAALLLTLLTLLALSVALARGTASSPVLRTLELPQGDGIVALATDARTGHVFVSISTPSGSLIRALTAATGASWRTITGSYTTRAPVLVVAPLSAHVFVAQAAAGHLTRVRMLDARTGTALRTVLTGLSPALMTIDGAGQRVAVASSGDTSCPGASPCPPPRGGVSVLDAASGRVLRRWRLPLQIAAIGLDMRANRLVIASANDPGRAGTVSIVDVANGRLLHRTPLALPPARVIMDDLTGRAFILSGFNAGPSPVTQASGRIDILDTRTGTLLRSIPLASPPSAAAIDTRTGHVFVLDRGPARLVRAQTTSGGLGTWLPTGPGHALMLDARSGRVLRVIPVGISPAGMAVDTARARVYIVNQGGRDAYGAINGTPLQLTAPLRGPGGLTILDAASGRHLRTIALGTAPTAVAVDAHAGRAFIADQGATTRSSAPDPWEWVPARLRTWILLVPPPPPAGRFVTTPSSIIVLDTNR